MNKLFSHLFTLLSLLLMTLLLSFCGRPDAVNTMEEMGRSGKGIPLMIPQQLDSGYYGTYRGILPTESGSEKQIVLTLMEDETYEYKEASLAHADKIISYSGEFEYSRGKNLLRLPKEGEDILLEFEEGKLYVLDEKSKRLTTEKSQSSSIVKSSNELELSIWRVARIANDKFQEEMFHQTNVRFFRDGTYAYTGGCNQCKGMFKSVEGKGVAFRIAACTKKMCQGENLDERIGKALLESASYEIEGKRLSFRDKEGNISIQMFSLL